MKKYNRHILNQVNFEFNTDNEQKAYALKANIDGFLKEDLFPKIEILFDESVSSDTTKRFDSIDIEMDMNSTENFESMSERVISQLRKKIEEVEADISRQTNLRTQTGYPSLNGEKYITGNIFRNQDSLEFDQQEMPSIENKSNMENTFLHFLESGQLPWYAIPSFISEFTQYSVFSSSLKDNLFVQALKNLFASNKNALERFIQQFDNDFIEDYVFQLLEDKNIDSRKLHLKISNQYQSIKELLYKLIINSLIHHDYQITNDQYVQLREEILNTNRTKALVKKRSYQIQEILKMVNLEIITEKLSIHKVHEQTTNESILSEKNSRIENHIRNVKKAELHLENIGKYGTSNADDSINEKIRSEEVYTDYINEYQSAPNINLKAVYIQNAGLILTHPFLWDLFMRTKCIDEKSILLPEKKSMAIHLLHYLATGQEQEMEYNLTFEKFLCCVPLDFPVNRKIVLSDQDKIECNDLLQSIINYWPALKKTSPDGLRQMFMQRDGKLDLQKAPYKLYIERKAQDALLDKLQWNISIVKLPWHTELLFVEW